MWSLQKLKYGTEWKYSFYLLVESGSDVSSPKVQNGSSKEWLWCMSDFPSKPRTTDSFEKWPLQQWVQVLPTEYWLRHWAWLNWLFKLELNERDVTTRVYFPTTIDAAQIMWYLVRLVYRRTRYADAPSVDGPACVTFGDREHSQNSIGDSVFCCSVTSVWCLKKMIEAYRMYSSHIC